MQLQHELGLHGHVVRSASCSCGRVRSAEDHQNDNQPAAPPSVTEMASTLELFGLQQTHGDGLFALA